MGLKTAEEGEEMQEDEADPILVVHPNYVPSDWTEHFLKLIN